MDWRTVSAASDILSYVDEVSTNGGSSWRQQHTYINYGFNATGIARMYATLNTSLEYIGSMLDLACRPRRKLEPASQSRLL